MEDSTVAGKHMTEETSRALEQTIRLEHQGMSAGASICVAERRGTDRASKQSCTSSVCLDERMHPMLITNELALKQELRESDPQT